jgi:hypothetical protein
MRSRVCPGEAEKAAASLASQVLSVSSTEKFFQFWHLGALHAGRCAKRCTQAATITPVTVVPAATRLEYLRLP